MENQSLQNQHREIDDLIAMTPTDDTMHRHWGRYLCVIIAGFVENAVQAVYEDYAYAVGNNQIAQYVSNQIAYTLGNPNAENILRAAGAFSSVWADELRIFMAEDDRLGAVNTVMRQRNQIAHGGQSTISPAQLRNYLPKCVEVIDFIENQCLSDLQNN